ncbi:MAG TPA: acetyl-CoA carboxylase carboxyltransferase subunit beta [Acholeplasmataceae bacterium]|jgi:acetyl-CoA carboxylase carboxyl transferase subunit beta|nr:acetyl-CoA carboxylase carboxyltransferase subunit beta [Acholeplasmataceae bacterium]
MNNFLDKRKQRLERYKNIRGKSNNITKITIPDGIFVKCEKCGEPIYHDDLLENDYVCPKCNYHFRLSARQRIAFISDENSFKELYANLKTLNPLDFPDYEKKVKQYQEAQEEFDAFVCGEAKIDGHKVALGVLDSFFMMGSMGSVVGEKVTRLIEYSIEHKLPLIIFSASGGARMQEGIFSLMQMAKTSAALKKHDLAGLLYISVLTHPTTGGVTASFASLGDINIAEPNALIGFAGKRVIEQTIQEKLPDGFQSAEFQKEKGFVDMVVDRKDLKNVISTILTIHKGN